MRASGRPPLSTDLGAATKPADLVDDAFDGSLYVRRRRSDEPASETFADLPVVVQTSPGYDLVDLPGWFQSFGSLADVRFTRTHDRHRRLCAPPGVTEISSAPVPHLGEEDAALEDVTATDVKLATDDDVDPPRVAADEAPHGPPAAIAALAGIVVIGSRVALVAVEQDNDPEAFRHDSIATVDDPGVELLSPILTGDGPGFMSVAVATATFTFRALPPVVEPDPAPPEAVEPEPVRLPVPAPARRPSAVTVASPEPKIRPAPTIEIGEGESGYVLPPLDLLAEPTRTEPPYESSAEYLDKSAVTLQQTLHDFGVRGEIIDANPGPVVTLYELEPAPGTKSSRVIGLSNDIARSMSAVSTRVAVVPGRNVIGIELPNRERETVFLRELLEADEFAQSRHRLAICLGKTIGGEPVIADLARMPHLLVAGTTGSGKSVAINTMILSLLFTHRPEECRLIMVDPKMLELSVYDGIPHLLTPVVTDPKKAVVALKWAVREMEERYRKMSRLGVRSIDGFNARIRELAEAGEAPTVETPDGETATMGTLPYIVVIVDEMADLMMVAGKDIEGAIQRLAQMARAAGIHLIMATQRPSVDVITGTIKANFPTRISFQVTSKIDSRTILGEMGAEQLLGQGDMLYMAGGGRITRVHGPFVSDGEVEKVVAHLKSQGRPEYLDDVTTGDDEVALTGSADEADAEPLGEIAAAGEDGPHYEQAVQLVMRDRKASTSYIQRRLGIGYNRAASIMERMENEGIVGPANHAGKREILRAAGRTIAG